MVIKFQILTSVFPQFRLASKSNYTGGKDQISMKFLNERFRLRSSGGIDEINDKFVVISICISSRFEKQIPPRISKEIFLCMFPTCNLIVINLKSVMTINHSVICFKIFHVKKILLAKLCW